MQNKKCILVFLISLLVPLSSAWAISGADNAAPQSEEQLQSHRAELKQYKESLKTKKQNASPKTEGFWSKEGVRSGLSETGNNVKSWFSSLGRNPANFFKDQERKYNERNKPAAK